MSDKTLERIEAARKKVEELVRRKERLSGEIDARKRRIAELEKKSQDNFGVPVTEIEAMVEKLEQESGDALVKAEKILGINGPVAEDEDAVP